MRTFTIPSFARYVLLAVGLLVGPALAWAQPANDVCANADVISCGQTLSGTTVGATFDNVGTCGTSNTAAGVWYAIGGTGGAITVSTCNQASYDTKISVFAGCGGPCVGGQDDATGCAGFTTEFTFLSALGTNYYILVHGFGTATGTFSLSASCAAPPMGNDACGGALPIACGQTVSGSTSTATFDNVGFCGTSNTAPGVWYTFIGTGDIVEFSTCSGGTNYDTKITAFSGTCGALICEAGNDDDFTCPSSGLQSTVLVVPTVAGVPYQVLVHGFGSATGSFDLTATCISPAPNDDVCDAIPLSLGVMTPFNNLGATVEPGEPNPGPGMTGLDGNPTTNSCNAIDGWCAFETDVDNSVWFTFTPPYDGCFEILVQGEDLQLAVWTADDCGNFGSFVEVGANDDSADDFWAANIFAPGFAVELGDSYYIQVDGFNGTVSSDNIILVRDSDLCPPDPYVCETTEGGPVLNLLTDNFGGETSWELTVMETGAFVDGAAGYPSGADIDIPLCADANCYTLTIFDSFGDGMCCSFGLGTWNLFGPDGELIETSPSGGAFGSSESIDFCFDPCDYDDVRPIVSCPSNFEVFTDQFICLADVTIPEPEVIDDCPTTLEGRVRKVDPNTLANLPGEGWSPWSADPSGFFGVGTYKVRWRATDQAGNRRGCTFYFTVSEVLPCPWVQLPDGVGCEDGNSATYADGVFTLNSTHCHNPISSNTDEFAFIQQTLCGDADIVAHVTSLTGTAFGWAGVIMRESNDPGSKSVAMMTSLSTTQRAEVRYTTNGTVQFYGFPSQGRHWVRISRVGNQFRLYNSFNGMFWSLKTAVNVPMNACLEVGLVLNSQVGSGDQTATFESVMVSGNTPAPTFQADIDGWEETVPATRSFTAYPNPTNGLTTVNLGDYLDVTARLEVVNTFGQVVFNRPLGSIENTQEELDLSNLPAGVYIIRLHPEEGDSEMIQIVKQ